MSKNKVYIMTYRNKNAVIKPVTLWERGGLFICLRQGYWIAKTGLKLTRIVLNC